MRCPWFLSSEDSIILFFLFLHGAQGAKSAVNAGFILVQGRFRVKTRPEIPLFSSIRPGIPLNNPSFLGENGF